MSPSAFPLPAVPSNDIDLELANHVISLRSTESVFLLSRLSFYRMHTSYNQAREISRAFLINGQVT